MHEDSYSTVYRGELEDGRLLAIECPKDSENQEFLLTGGLEIKQLSVTCQFCVTYWLLC